MQIFDDDAANGAELNLNEGMVGGGDGDKRDGNGDSKGKRVNGYSTFSVQDSREMKKTEEMK